MTKWMFGATVVSAVSVLALLGCGEGASNTGSGGSGGSGGEAGSMTSSSSSGMGGMAGAGGDGGAAGAGGAPNACDNSGNCMGCQSCAQKMGGPCAAQAAAFQMLPNAMTFYNCVVPCQQKPTPMEQQTCAQTCCMANQTECTAYNAFVLCVVCDTCPMDCSMQAAACPP